MTNPQPKGDAMPQDAAQEGHDARDALLRKAALVELASRKPTSGARIRFLRREALGITPQQLAERVKKEGAEASPRSVWNWENDRATPLKPARAALAAVLDVPEGVLFTTT